MVEDEEPLKVVLKDFHQWLTTENLLDQKFAFVTCGDWDFRQLLPRQCLQTGLEIPAYFKSWINIKMVRVDRPLPPLDNTLHAMTENRPIIDSVALFRYSSSQPEFIPVIYLTCCPTPIWYLSADYTVA